jgi:hypothetical protein
MNLPVGLAVGLGLPVLMVVIWLAVTSILALASGWLGLMAVYPDRAEAPLVKLPGQSGWMGAVHMQGALTFSACPSGLRVGMSRLLGPFCRDFLVPWSEISARSSKNWGVPVVTLEFGSPASGRLGLRADVAARLATAAGANWPAA